MANSEANQERLKALWDKRSARPETMDFPIGPGDVIAIAVPGVNDLADRTVRVSGSGEIELPLIGIIQASGQTESGLRDKLRGALSKYMYDPQVDVFVKEYHSRQVAVVGAVRNPGLVILTGAGETILDVITQAGGMTPDAADEIVILPEVKGGHEKLEQLADSLAEPSPIPPSPGRKRSRILTPIPRRHRCRIRRALLRRKLRPRTIINRLPRKRRITQSISRPWKRKSATVPP